MRVNTTLTFANSASRTEFNQFLGVFSEGVDDSGVGVAGVLVKDSINGGEDYEKVCPDFCGQHGG